MSDQDDIFNDDAVAGDEGAETAERGGFIGGALFNILKWIAIGLASIILIATVSFVTFNLMGGSQEPQGFGDFSTEKPSDAIDLQFFNVGLESIRGQTADDPPLSFLASVNIGYAAGDTRLQTELNAKSTQIQNRILLYLGTKTARELTTANLPTLQDELKTILNQNLIRTGIIHAVLFSEVQTF